mmetsp:Transcript_24663/g.58233  ORF Transcript_24663/g.58233 Transcript_24663/m.58233 type:complete len:234 (-) Transcript_24663:250-951(-)
MLPPPPAPLLSTASSCVCVAVASRMRDSHVCDSKAARFFSDSSSERATWSWSCRSSHIASARCASTTASACSLAARATAAAATGPTTVDARLAIRVTESRRCDKASSDFAIARVSVSCFAKALSTAWVVLPLGLFRVSMSCFAKALSTASTAPHAIAMIGGLPAWELYGCCTHVLPGCAARGTGLGVGLLGAVASVLKLRRFSVSANSAACWAASAACASRCAFAIAPSHSAW